MKRIICILSISLLLAGCTAFDDGHPYQDDLQTMQVQAVYPEGYQTYARSGVKVKAQEISNGNTYCSYTDERGRASFCMPHGIYLVSLTDRADKTALFNGSLQNVQLVDGDLTLDMDLIYARPGTIVFKEVYFGGCPKTPLEGTLQNDQYFILHNNDTQTQYLDGLCFGSVDPMNSSGNNGWVTTSPDGKLVFQEFAPINECLWRFQGSGTDFPLAPGADAVVAVRGAVDFTAEFPLSVNLNKKEYFATFSRLHFENENLHISPGDQILASHILEVPKKTGQSKAYTITTSSPAVVIFRPDEGFDLDAYLADDSRCVATVPGGSTKCVKVPWDWIMDGVEVFYSTKNNKRIELAVDAGAFTFSSGGLGHTIHRLRDDEASEAAGFDIYTDTNNSSSDFYERETQSLHQ